MLARGLLFLEEEWSLYRTLAVSNAEQRREDEGAEKRTD